MAEHGEQREPGTVSGPARPEVNWFPEPDPVESFGNTVEQALRRLSIELAGLRAERDGLRLELEGVRTQCELLRQQLADRERFAATVRELSEITRHLTLPTRWAGDPVAAQHLAQPDPPPAPEPVVTPVPEPAPAPEEQGFFDQPGIWVAEPERGDARRHRFRRWARRIATVVLAVVVLGVLVISVGPRVLPYQTFFVRSGSMEPTIDTGSMIFLTKVDASDLDRGDIITFERPDEPGTMVTHRILAIESTDAGRFFRTKGDANGAPDSWRVPASGTGWKYAFDIPKVGFVFGYLGTDQARLVLLAIPAALLGLLSLIDIRRPSGRSPAPRRRR